MDNNMDTITNAITQPINAEDVPKPLRDIVVKAKRAWLRNNEVVEILSNFACMGLNVRGGCCLDGYWHGYWHAIVATTATRQRIENVIGQLCGQHQWEETHTHQIHTPIQPNF